MKLNRIILVLFCLLVLVMGLRSRVGSAQGPAVAINIDASAGRHTINPNIYGVAFGTTAQLADLNCPINRSGGNANALELKDLSSAYGVGESHIPRARCERANCLGIQPR